MSLLHVEYKQPYGGLEQNDGGKKRRHKKTRKNMASKKEIIVGKIYAEWCGACKALAPEWAKMHKILSKKRQRVKFIEIEESKIAEELPKIKQEYGVDITYTGYPTIFTIVDGQVKYYNQNRTAREMANWFMSGGKEPTVSEMVVPGFFGGNHSKRYRRYQKTEKIQKKPVGFLGFFFE